MGGVSAVSISSAEKQKKVSDRLRENLLQKYTPKEERARSDYLNFRGEDFEEWRCAAVWKEAFKNRIRYTMDVSRLGLLQAILEEFTKELLVQGRTLPADVAHLQDKLQRKINTL